MKGSGNYSSKLMGYMGLCVIVTIAPCGHFTTPSLQQQQQQKKAELQWEKITPRVQVFLLSYEKDE